MKSNPFPARRGGLHTSSTSRPRCSAAVGWGRWLLLLLLVGSGAAAHGADGAAGKGREKAKEAPVRLPANYRLLYAQSFERATALNDFAFTDPKAWRYAATNGTGSEVANGALELVRQSQYKPAVRSPVNIALLADRTFGDFILEVDLIQTGKEYGHRDMCLFYGVQDPAHFYYTHIATAADDHAHNTFIVTNAPRIKIARETTRGANWGLGIWHTVRIERTLADGAIRVYFDDLSKPIMIAEDKTFGAGYIGFGSFDDTGMIDNIRIWGPSAADRPATFFQRRKD